MAVARTGHVEAAKVLLEHGADVERGGAVGRANGAHVGRRAEPAGDDPRAHRARRDVDARGRVRDWQRRVTAEPRLKNMKHGGFTPLLYAAREGCGECARRSSRAARTSISRIRTA